MSTRHPASLMKTKHTVNLDNRHVCGQPRVMTAFPCPNLPLNPINPINPINPTNPTNPKTPINLTQWHSLLSPFSRRYHHLPEGCITLRKITGTCTDLASSCYRFMLSHCNCLYLFYMFCYLFVSFLSLLYLFVSFCIFLYLFVSFIADFYNICSCHLINNRYTHDMRLYM